MATQHFVHQGVWNDEAILTCHAEGLLAVRHNPHNQPLGGPRINGTDEVTGVLAAEE